VSRFTAYLDVRMLEGPDGRPLLKAGRCQWEVGSPLTYEVGAEGSGESITVPPGATTDLASIPRAFWRLYPPDGPWLKAAVVHDWLYRNQGINCGQMVRAEGVNWRVTYSRAQADAILKEAMGVLGVGWLEREVIYRAVRLGGGSGWGAGD